MSNLQKNMKIIFQETVFNLFNYLLDICFFFKDLLFFKFSKKNSQRSYKIMLRLFYLTGGLSNDIINFFVSKKPFIKKISSGIFLKFSEDEILKYKNQLDDNGYVIIDNIKF